MPDKIHDMIRQFCSTKNKFENKVILELVKGLSGNNSENVDVGHLEFPLYGFTKYIIVKTKFAGKLNIFTRRVFSGRSGQKYKPDIIIFEGENPPFRRENPKPSVVIEIKEGKQTKESNRSFQYQILSETLDFLPKLAIMITEKESDREEDMSMGYEGLLLYYGIQNHAYYHSNHIRDCIPEVIMNGIIEEFTKKKLVSSII